MSEDDGTPRLTFNNYLSAFKSISGLLASVGVLIPGFAYFTKYAPPFGEIALLAAALATATIFITYYYTPKTSNSPDSRLPPLVKSAIKAFIAAIFLLLLYLVLLDLCTVLIPGTDKRVQIGFDKFDWSLTDHGKQVKAEKPIALPQEWLSDESFRKDVAKLYWQPWSIYLAGIALILIFIFAFVLWAFGWSLIAKQKAISMS
jgi:hypothetical protein